MNQPTNTDATLPSLPFRSALVVGRKILRFNFAPDAAARAAMAKALGLLDLPAFAFRGELQPLGRSDVVLQADLTAVVVQPCSVSLAPVTTRLADQVERRFQDGYALPQADELEIPAEDVEPLPEVIDVAAVALESLALALPLYPRAAGVELGEVVFAPPGVEAIKAEDVKPFAGLAGLAERLKRPENGGE